VSRSVLIRDTFATWLRDEEPVLSCSLTPDLLPWPVPTLHVTIRRGRPEMFDDYDGATMHVTDGDTEWAEYYESVAVAVARLAALVKCVEDGEHFKDGPGGFVRWADNFFTQTTSEVPHPPQAPTGP
jgi:hypothetical protein